MSSRRLTLAATALGSGLAFLDSTVVPALVVLAVGLAGGVAPITAAALAIVAIAAVATSAAIASLALRASRLRGGGASL